MFDRNYSIVKSNKLVEAQYKLTLTEQRLILLMVSLIKPGDEDFKLYRFQVKDFLQFWEIENRPTIYKEILHITEKIMERVIKFITPDNDYYMTHWIQTAKYKAGTGYIDVTFDPEMKPFLLELKEKFLSYKIGNIIKLKSAYSIRIYELLKQYESIGKRTFKIELLKDILGIKKNEYLMYHQFKQRIIEPAQKELSIHSDIYFEFNEIKTLRKVTSIEFLIFPQQSTGESREDIRKLILASPMFNKTNENIDQHIPDSNKTPCISRVNPAS